MIVLDGDDIILGQETDEKGIDLPLRVWHMLRSAYPTYSWHVSEQGGMLIIKELGLSALYGAYGMAYPVHKIQSFTAFKQQVIFLAGELLERARLPRNGWDGERPALEGTDPRFYRPGALSVQS